MITEEIRIEVGKFYWINWCSEWQEAKVTDLATTVTHKQLVTWRIGFPIFGVYVTETVEEFIRRMR